MHERSKRHAHRDPTRNREAIQGRDPLPTLDAIASRQAWPRTPNDDTTPQASMPDPPTTRTTVRFVNPNLDRTLPVDSMGSVVHHLCGDGTERPDKKFGVPWSI